MTEVFRYKAVKMLTEGGSKISYDPHGPEFVLAEAYDRLAAVNLELAAALAEARGLRPEGPPRPPEGAGLPRYGLRWNGPSEPLSVPMADGYWTPWHLADAMKKQMMETLTVDTALLEERNRLVNAIPHCPEHGPCIPHAIAWVEAAKALTGELTAEDVKP